MTKITSEDILKLARLARLRISDDEIESYRQELDTIVGYFVILDKAEIDGLEPTSQVTGLQNVFRTDEVAEQVVQPDRLLEELPSKDDRYIKVKRMI